MNPAEQSGQKQQPARRNVLRSFGLLGGGAVIGASVAAAGITAANIHGRNRADAPPRAEDSDQVLNADVFFRCDKNIGQPRIALTFDDGPDEKWTPTVLNMLATAGPVAAKGTFFQMGSALESAAGKDLCRQVKAAGHEIGVHAYEHYNLSTLTLDEVRKQVKSTYDLLAETTGQKPAVFRPPYGAINGNVLRVAAENDLQIVLWSHHITGSDPVKMRHRLLTSVYEGAVVLMHDGRVDPNDELMQQLGFLLKDLGEKQISAVTTTELMRGCV